MCPSPATQPTPGFCIPALEFGHRAHRPAASTVETAGASDMNGLCIWGGLFPIRKFIKVRCEQSNRHKGRVSVPWHQGSETGLAKAIKPDYNGKQFYLTSSLSGTSGIEH